LSYSFIAPILENIVFSVKAASVRACPAQGKIIACELQAPSRQVLLCKKSNTARKAFFRVG
jgi:hypothetical protein